jgi:hypothetical protein
VTGMDASGMYGFRVVRKPIDGRRYKARHRWRRAQVVMHGRTCVGSTFAGAVTTGRSAVGRFHCCRFDAEMSEG